MTGYVDHPVSPGTMRWAAERVLDMHVERVEADRTTGRCGQCQPDGRCRMLHWARVVLPVGPLIVSETAWRFDGPDRYLRLPDQRTTAPSARPAALALCQTGTSRG
jgi:hypothetical protein